MSGTLAADSSKVMPLVEFLSPTELQDYQPPTGQVLVGDNHVQCGAVFVVGGAPGVGKSRATVAMAVAGATGQPWFGLPVHRQFKTMILQNENGRGRLKNEFSEVDCKAIKDWVRVCPPPPCGMAFCQPEFCEVLKRAVMEFRPDVFIIDPWVAAVRDDKQRDYLETFNIIRAVIPSGDCSPALGIVAHTRKPKTDERATGRSLLNLLAGSYVLGSVPRTVFIIQPASDDPTDDRVVWTCCKNNDGELGAPSVWRRRNGLFEQVDDFDWVKFGIAAPVRRTIAEADIARMFNAGKHTLPRKEAVKKLMEMTACGHSACYNALKLDGKFSSRLREEEGMLAWNP